MFNKITELLKGKSFDELVDIYEAFISKEFNLTIESIILDKMMEIDEVKFIEWEQTQ